MIMLRSTGNVIIVALMLASSPRASAGEPSLNGRWQATPQDCASEPSSDGLQQIIVTDKRIIITLITGDATNSLACDISARKQKGRLILVKATCDGGDNPMKLTLGAILGDQTARFDLSLTGIPTMRSILRRCEVN
jgi:hypothetical protein